MYDNVGNWSWEFDPPPYDFLAPRDSAAQPAPVLYARGFGALPLGVRPSAAVRIVPPGTAISAAARAAAGPSALQDRLSRSAGLSGCGCGCGGGCGHHAGLGLFDTGLDFAGWGIPEWVIVAGGGYLAISLVFDLFAAGRTVKKFQARSSKRRAIRQRYKRELAAA